LQQLQAPWARNLSGRQDEFMESAGGNPLFVDANPEISEASWAFPCQEALEKASRRWKLFCSLDARVTPRNGRNSGIFDICSMDAR